MEYEIKLGQQKIGRMEVKQEGLYLSFQGKCQLSGEVLYRILAKWPDGEQDLGILIPEQGTFCLRKRIARKHCGTGEPEFRAVPSHREDGKDFIAVYPEEPFAYIHKIRDLYLVKRDGQVGVNIRE